MLTSILLPEILISKGNCHNGNSPSLTAIDILLLTLQHNTVSIISKFKHHRHSKQYVNTTSSYEILCITNKSWTEMKWQKYFCFNVDCQMYYDYFKTYILHIFYRTSASYQKIMEYLCLFMYRKQTTRWISGILLLEVYNIIILF